MGVLWDDLEEDQEKDYNLPNLPISYRLVIIIVVLFTKASVYYFSCLVLRVCSNT